MKTQTILRNAAKQIEKYGFHKRAFFAEPAKYTVPMCVDAALMKVTRHYGKSKLPSDAKGYRSAKDALVRFLGRKYKDVYSVVEWNDRPRTTKEMAIKALNGTADQLDQDEANAKAAK